VRLRLCAPVPHDLVHVDQAPKADTVQWIGHGPWLHACVSAEGGHAAPPNFGSTVTRLRCCEPAPQDVVQVEKPPKAGTTQSTGHLGELHVRTSWACGHDLPPNVGDTRLRLRL